MVNIAVLVSGGGTNLQALIDAEQAGKIPHGKITLVLASNPKAYALERAAKAGIPTTVVSRKEYPDQDAKNSEQEAYAKEAENYIAEELKKIWRKA